MKSLSTLPDLAARIGHIHEEIQRATIKHVNSGLTARNWLIGYYIFEYEQSGTDRAAYGEQVLQALAQQAKTRMVTGLSYSALKSCRQFYLAYPQIGQTVSGQLQWLGLKPLAVMPSVGDESLTAAPNAVAVSTMAPDLLLSRLTFSHFIELLKAETPLKRAFYEVQAVSNNWSVRDLKRAMETSLFERTGLSQDKAAVLAAHTGEQPLTAAQLLREPYVLEFLELPDRLAFRESDLETAIVGQLEKFLMEMGRGFCFEARQKRLTFDNEHLFVDLVFYHRILKCHVLIDLKIGTFSHADAGQMNVYLNYYREHEMSDGDNPPVGLILCAQKNDALVHYATGGLSQQVFVSKYQLNLPTEEELRELVEKEQARLGV